MDGSGNLVARYTQSQNIDEPLAMLRSGTASFYHADGLGSITSLTSSSDAIAASYTFDSFGNQNASTGSLTNPFRYTARELDSETGLNFYRARYFNPITGRFLSEDPAGFRGGIDFYPYAENRAVNFTDPTGRYIQVFGDSMAWVQALRYLTKVPQAREAILSIAKSPLTVTILVDPSLECGSSTGGGEHFGLFGTTSSPIRHQN